MFSDNEPSCLSAHLSFSVINVKEDSFLMVRITHVAGKFLPRNNLHLLSSVCLCGLFHSGVIYCSTISLALISHSSGWDVIFFLGMSAPWKLKVFVAQRVTSSAPLLLTFSFFFCFSTFPEHVFQSMSNSCTQRMNAKPNVALNQRFNGKKYNRFTHLH